MKLFFAIAMLFSSSAYAIDCVNVNRVRGFTTEGRSTLILDAGRKDYALELKICPDLRWAEGIGFDNRGRFDVCEGDKVVLFDLSGRVLDKCTIWEIDEITN